MVPIDSSNSKRDIFKYMLIINYCRRDLTHFRKNGQNILIVVDFINKTKTRYS